MPKLTASRAAAAPVVEDLVAGHRKPCTTALPFGASPDSD